jgi:chemosensory pili system protein ChpA (sensor histidine kinase/response regulator)
MKLSDLIDALASEVARAENDLVALLARIDGLGADDPQLAVELDAYCELVQRMGQAAQIAGFDGLEWVCQHVLQNALLLGAGDDGHKPALMAFLREWPGRVVHYLRHVDDPSTAAGLVDLLRAAPQPMEEVEGLRVMHMLGALPAQALLDSLGEVPERPMAVSADDCSLSLPGDLDASLLTSFEAEAPEQARAFVAMVQDITAGEPAADLAAARRCAHTIKGAAATLGARGVAFLAHQLEDVLDFVEQQGSKLSRRAAAILLDGAFCLEQMVGFLCTGEDPPADPVAVVQLVVDLARAADRKDESLTVEHAQDPQAPPASGQQGHPSPEAAGAKTPMLRVQVQRLDEMIRLSGELSVHGSAQANALKVLADRTAGLLAQLQRLQRRVFELETRIDLKGAAVVRSGRASDAGFDALEFDRYGELHSVSHALAEETSDARAIGYQLDDAVSRLSGLHDQQHRLTQELHYLAMGSRMTAVGSMESRWHRTVRTTCQATGKEALLKVEGADTLMDSDVLTRLSEPLLHLLRNAIDHGLEEPQRRESLGKPRHGTIRLSFARQGQQVVLSCEDDGRGLDLEAIRRRGVERGLVAASQQLSDDEVTQLVLLPGFSSKQEVSEISGRGVGLDVVNQWAIGMNGQLRIRSRPGRGCSLELRFAASLSTVAALVVEAAGQRFALASAQVEQAVARGLGRFDLAAPEPLYHLGDRVLPAVALAGLVHPGAAEVPADQLDAVLVRNGAQVVALGVERLLDAGELLVKPPGRYATHLKAVSGLSLLGDGAIAIHLDLHHLLAAKRPPVLAGADSRGAGATSSPHQPLVLLVDDSLTVRTALSRLMEQQGLRTELARDGVEAVEALRHATADLVLTDLEMPNMNGVELTRHIRSEPRLRHIPVVMITSRSQHKHRSLAESAGVDGYVTKPYNEQDLVALVSQVLDMERVAA